MLITYKKISECLKFVQRLEVRHLEIIKEFKEASIPFTVTAGSVGAKYLKPHGGTATAMYSFRAAR
jgi:hypothetical protein